MSMGQFKKSRGLYEAKTFSTIHADMIRCIYIVIYLTTISTAGATDYYVATYGDNSNLGTLDAPKKNFSNSAWFNSTNVKPGDIIYLIDGIWYNETIWLTDNNQNIFVTGNSTNSLKITAYNGTPTIQNVDSGSASNKKYGIFGANKTCCINNIVISNISIQNSYYGMQLSNIANLIIDNVIVNQSNSAENTDLLFISDIKDSVIMNSEFTNGEYNTLEIMANFMNVYNITIRNNKIHENRKHGLINLGNLRADTEVKDIVIENNQLYDGIYPSFYQQYGTGAQSRMHNITFKNNTIYNMSGNGMNVNLNMLVDSVIENNYIYDSNNGFYSSPYYMLDNVTVRNNTLQNISNKAIDIILNDTSKTIYFINNDISYYFVRNGNMVITDAKGRSQLTLDATRGTGSIITFNFRNNKIFSENGANTTYYYPDISEYTTIGKEIVTITTYNMTARPASGYATVTVNKFNTSLPAGQVLVNFTANTTNGNQVNFTISTLNALKNYTIKRDGAMYTTVQADSGGVIRFNNSAWSNRTFTVEEIIDYGSLSGTVKDTGGSSLISASVTAGAYTNITNSTGGYLFTNIAIGNYTVTASRSGYNSVSQNAQVLANQTTNLNFTLTRITGTGNISGNVTNKTSGVPIIGVTVTDGVITTTTGAIGKYFLANVTNGSRNITASKTGYQAATKTINVVENSNVTLDFQLEPLLPPAVISFLPGNLTPSQDEGTTNTFSVAVDQPVTNKWFLDSVQQSETSQSYTKTWSYTDAGIHNITYSGENSNGTVSKTWNVTVIDYTDTTPPIITLTSPESRAYATNIIPLTYYANEPVSNCIVAVDSTANQSLPLCENLSVISREYEAASNTPAWWHFNENVSNLAQDSSGNANTAAISGASWTEGKFGSALQFDGSSSYVEVPDSNVLDGGSQITIEAWVKPVLGTRGTIVAKYTYNSSVYDRAYELDIDTSGKVNFALSSNGTSSGTVWLTSSNSVTNNTWNHITATSNGMTMKIYINGTLDPNTKSAPPVIHSSPYNLQIGAWRYEPGGTIDTYFNGVIDEARILNTTMTEEKIREDYALGEGSHNVTIYAKDISGNSNSTTRDFTINLGIPDTTPPASITSLQNITYAQTYISWTWTDPADADFSKVMIYLNGTFQTNVTKGVQFYNATGLTNDTSYTISTHTVDTSGNINQTWINHTARTAPAPSNPDVNLDGSIDIADLVIVAQHFSETTTSPYPRYDVNADGKVNVLDITLVASKI